MAAQEGSDPHQVSIIVELPDIGITPDMDYDILGMETPMPVLKLGKYTFEGYYVTVPCSQLVVNKEDGSAEVVHKVLKFNLAIPLHSVANIKDRT
mmetsp:Transcript_9314/g.25338  ORF Transcript_9314/g.25338 Transcript_9314/m.25338 type:complete len:95 (+) Transcript_9314:156-440(+)